MAKVLLVDDELTMVQMVTEMLRQEGHEVFPFTNTQAASAALTPTPRNWSSPTFTWTKPTPHGLEILQKGPRAHAAGQRHRHHRVRLDRYRRGSDEERRL